MGENSLAEVPLWRWEDAPETVAEVLRQGGVVAIPTESSYGLAVDPCNLTGVQAIYRLKQREAGKPLPLVAADRGQLEALGVHLAGADVEPWVELWPAPLTLVLPFDRSRRGELPAAAGGQTVAVRVPDHPQLRRLLAVVGPVTATSANASGEAPLLEVQAVQRFLAQRLGPHGGGGPAVPALVVDGGALPGGAPSTLVEPPRRILRPGRFPVSAIPGVATSEGNEG